ncbi:acyl-CoA dehydrogenase family protein [Sediminivirga luteola]|uniref:Acyl-CoA dehydrogenase n=1 Tax=Sediminivirga luteola TaxID=1774748 RepID=A0A8J2XLY2_9MICO|nr:acyl-CoA dehydrogenase family protein [Sediminivirga luteola]MCI2266834.1 acyl-CoA/acyl-ACP dehydrogenase [Sediminivirga luteola]GGA26963.1 acyl-CoA dehydrogenase [Sediminivirga luteola]
MTDSASAGGQSSRAEDLIDAVRDFAQHELLPRAARTDVHGVPATHIDRLRELGALNAPAGPEFNGPGLTPAQDRTLHEILAGACPNTWLVWAQHDGAIPRMLSLLKQSSALTTELYKVLTGTTLAGVALSDVRHYPERHIAAERVAGGWLLSGAVSWYTGLGLSESLLISAVTPRGPRGETDQPHVVTAVIPLREGISAEPLPLAALGGSRTVRLLLEEVPVYDEDVIGIQSYAAWKRGDQRFADNPQPYVFGVAERVLEELRDDPFPEARDVAECWAPYVEELRSRAYQAIDDDTVAPAVRRGLKVHSADVLATLTRALLAARGGRALKTSDPAQLYARTAQFFQVQSQSAEVRRTQLVQLTQVPPRIPDFE